MSLFGFRTAPSSRTQNSSVIVARYKRLRPIRRRLNDELVNRLPSDVIREGAGRIGLLHRDSLVMDNEDQFPILMDYCIYDVYCRGRNAIEQYLCDYSPDSDSDEMACLRAMQHASYTVLAVLHVERGVGCQVRNLFTEETRLLVDIGLSKTAQRGTLMATRLLDFGDFVATSGAPLAMGILDDDQLDDWQRVVGAGRREDDFDPAPLIRACLQREASFKIAHEDVGAERQPGHESTLPPSVDPRQRKRALAKRLADKPAKHRRCRCGSGRMFKNCCGKR